MNERTSVYLEPEEHERLMAIAAAENKLLNEVIREAVTEYVAKHPVPETAATGEETEDDEQTAEELLKGSGPG